MSKNIIIQSVGEVTEVANNIINIYAPFIEEMKNNNEKIRKVYLTKTGRERKGAGIHSLSSIFGITPPDVTVEAVINGCYFDENTNMYEGATGKFVINITDLIFNEGLYSGLITVCRYTGAALEKTLIQLIEEKCKFALSKANEIFEDECLGEEGRKQRDEDKKFIKWVESITPSDDDNSKRLLELVKFATHFHSLSRNAKIEFVYECC